MVGNLKMSLSNKGAQLKRREIEIIDDTNSQVVLILINVTSEMKK